MSTEFINAANRIMENIIELIPSLLESIKPKIIEFVPLLMNNIKPKIIEIAKELIDYYKLPITPPISAQEEVTHFR